MQEGKNPFDAAEECRQIKDESLVSYAESVEAQVLACQSDFSYILGSVGESEENERGNAQRLVHLGHHESEHALDRRCSAPTRSCCSLELVFLSVCMHVILYNTTHTHTHTHTHIGDVMILWKYLKKNLLCFITFPFSLNYRVSFLPVWCIESERGCPGD